jgi:peptidoglycan/xylan/chitin deacetylase (PgdA/CDA1 family)
LHGYAHENAGTLTEEQERAMFHRAYEVVGNLTGKAPVGNRTPAWDLTPYTVDILQELNLTYDSSLMSTDYTPFYLRKGDVIPVDGPAVFGTPTELVELPVSWSLDDYPHFEYLRGVMPGHRLVDDVYKNWMDDMRYMIRDFENGVAVVTFHPQAIGRGHRLLGLERWLDELREMPLDFLTLEEVAQKFRDGTPLGVYMPQKGSHR